jgi:hypothetical protein
MNCQRNVSSILRTELPHTFSYIVAHPLDPHDIRFSADCRPRDPDMYGEGTGRSVGPGLRAPGMPCRGACEALTLPRRNVMKKCTYQNGGCAGRTILNLKLHIFREVGCRIGVNFPSVMRIWRSTIEDLNNIHTVSISMSSAT